MSTLLNLVQLATHCRFCGYLNSESPHEDINTPWLSDHGYGALVSLGALVPGWSLVCPVKHANNMAAHYGNAEFWNFAWKVKDLVSARYGNVCVFEHGSRYELSSTGCGTGHAHMHVVPLSWSLIQESLNFDKERAWQMCAASDVEKLSAGKEYLFVADKFEGADTVGILCVLEHETSQFFRKVIAQRLRMESFSDYHRYPMIDITRTSVVQLRSDVKALAEAPLETVCK